MFLPTLIRKDSNSTIVESRLQHGRSHRSEDPMRKQLSKYGTGLLICFVLMVMVSTIYNRIVFLKREKINDSFLITVSHEIDEKSNPKDLGYVSLGKKSALSNFYLFDKKIDGRWGFDNGSSGVSQIYVDNEHLFFACSTKEGGTVEINVPFSGKYKILGNLTCVENCEGADIDFVVEVKHSNYEISTFMRKIGVDGLKIDQDIGNMSTCDSVFLTVRRKPFHQLTFYKVTGELLVDAVSISSSDVVMSSRKVQLEKNIKTKKLFYKCKNYASFQGEEEIGKVFKAANYPFKYGYYNKEGEFQTFNYSGSDASYTDGFNGKFALNSGWLEATPSSQNKMKTNLILRFECLKEATFRFDASFECMSNLTGCNYEIGALSKKALEMHRYSYHTRYQNVTENRTSLSETIAQGDVFDIYISTTVAIKLDVNATAI